MLTYKDVKFNDTAPKNRKNQQMLLEAKNKFYFCYFTSVG